MVFDELIKYLHYYFFFFWWNERQRKWIWKFCDKWRNNPRFRAFPRVFLFLRAWTSRQHNSFLINCTAFHEPLPVLTNLPVRLTIAFRSTDFLNKAHRARKQVVAWQRMMNGTQPSVAEATARKFHLESLFHKNVKHHHTTCSFLRDILCSNQKVVGYALEVYGSFMTKKKW